jgi:hypothetical protein
MGYRKLVIKAKTTILALLFFLYDCQDIRGRDGGLSFKKVKFQKFIETSIVL